MMVVDVDEKPTDLIDASPTSTEPEVEAAIGEDLQRSISRRSAASQNNVVLGGTRAWLQVLGGFCAFINIW